jgi:hypothetical protein
MGTYLLFWAKHSGHQQPDQTYPQGAHNSSQKPGQSYLARVTFLTDWMKLYDECNFGMQRKCEECSFPLHSLQVVLLLLSHLA